MNKSVKETTKTKQISTEQEGGSQDIDESVNAYSNSNYMIDVNTEKQSSYSFTDKVLNPNYVLGYN